MVAAKGILPRGDAAAAGALVRDLLERSRPRLDVQKDTLDVLWNRHPISFPEGVENKSYIYSGIGQAQVGILLGMISGDLPKVRYFTPNLNQSTRGKIEAIEGACNVVFQALEQQQRTQVFARAQWDQVVHGFGVTALRYMPGRWSQAPKREDHDDAKGYLRARGRFAEKMGVAFGGLPLIWSYIPAERFLWREGWDGGLSVGMVVHTRNLAELLADPRYDGEMSTLRAAYGSMLDSEPALALKKDVRFIEIETADLCTYFVLPTAEDMTQKTFRRYAIDDGWDYENGEIALQYDNPVGRPRFSFLPGLIANSEEVALKYRGILYDQLWLIKSIDSFLSHRYVRAKRYSFPPYVAEQVVIPIQGTGTSMLPGANEAGKTNQEILKLSPDGITVLPVGMRLVPVLNPGGGQEEMLLFQEIKNFASLLGFPESVINGLNTNSGYQYESLNQFVATRFKPLLRGTENYWTDNVRLFLDTVRSEDEPLTVLARRVS